MATIIEQLASNSDFIARFKDDSKTAVQALIDTEQIAEDAHMVKISPTQSIASTDTPVVSQFQSRALRASCSRARVCSR
jgi:hypothetical protein